MAGIEVAENLVFNNGVISSSGAKGNILMGSAVDGSTMLTADANTTYFSGSNGTNITMGITTGVGNHMTVDGNRSWGGRKGLLVREWASASVQTNRIVNRTISSSDTVIDLRDPTLSGYSWESNIYYRDSLSTSWIAYYQTSPHGLELNLRDFLNTTGFASSETPDFATTAAYPQQVLSLFDPYDLNRAVIYIYNPTGSGTVNVNMGSFLSFGQPYKVFNVQKDVFDDPVLSTTYNGSSVPFPMTGVPGPLPLGRTTSPPPDTGPYFHAFIVTR